jgi:heme b synthase
MDNTSSVPSYQMLSPCQNVPTLRMLFWELTNACNMQCVHCRAEPSQSRSSVELSTSEAISLLEEIVSFAKPVVVLSGGEPLIRPDWGEIASYGASLGLRMLLATNGSLVTREIAEQMASCGIQRISVSIDGADEESHDGFRGVRGAFEAAWRGIENARAAGIPYQINTTVTKRNIGQLPQILQLAVERGAAALHLFLLVPTGCGKEIAQEEMIEPSEYEQVLEWLFEQSRSVAIDLRATCAPHYYRVVLQRSGSKPSTENHSGQRASSRPQKGCLAGSAVCFVSHAGDVFPCGYLPVAAGNVRREPLAKIWQQSDVFRLLRDENNLQGKCGYCEYRRVCMGCRARAYAVTGNYLSAEPYCIYEPRRVSKKNGEG